MVFVCYITHGRDKDTYHTEFVGLFSKFCTAAIALIGKLIKMGFVEAYDEQHQPICVPRTPYDMDNDRLRQFVQQYQDSYFEDGWNYTIVSKDVDVEPTY